MRLIEFFYTSITKIIILALNCVIKFNPFTVATLG